MTNEISALETQRAEELQALGFDSEAEYAQHQQTLTRAKNLAASQTFIEVDGPWCLLPA